MKKLLFVFTLFFFYQLSYAQLSYGINGGINASMIKFSNDRYETSPKFGMHLGVFGSYPLNEKIALRPELYFSTEGNKWNTKNSVGDVKLNQIRIPILFTYQVNDKLFIEAGPQYHLLLSISQKTNDEERVDLKYLYKSGVIGFGVGASYSIDELLQGLSVGLRYNGDLSPINSSNVGGGDLYTKLIQLNLSYQIGTTK